MAPLILAALITLTLPLLDTAGDLLPPIPLVAVLYNSDPLAVGAAIGYPGERLTMQTEWKYGCWYATAYAIGESQSAPSGTVCKGPRERCYDCHQ